MKTITIENLFNCRFVESDHRYAAEMYWSKLQNTFIHRIVRCYSGVDGTCQCNSHDSHYEILLTPDKAIELLKEWGYVLEESVDASKTRRRAEDALRKNSSLATLLAIAKLLNVEVAIKE